MASKKKISKEELALLPQGCVLYLDGGCRPGYPSDPNTMYGGWGMHGYTYHMDIHPDKPRMKKDIPTTLGYEDGTKVPVSQQVIPTGYIDGYGSLTNRDTNNTAELYGLLHGLEKVKALHESHKVNYAKFLLDSQYAIKGVTEYYPVWEARHFMKPDGKEPIANAELWKVIGDTYKDVTSKIKLDIGWVPGHSGNVGNEKADQLATLGVFIGRNGKIDTAEIKDSPIQKYGDPEIEVNRLFQKNRLYFNHGEPVISKTGHYAYHCGAHGPDDTLVGMRMFDSTAYIVYTKELQTIIEKVKQFHHRVLPNPLNDLCMIRLDAVLLPRIYEQIQSVGPECLTLNLRGYEGTATTDGQMATRVIKPSGLTFKLIDVHNAMADKLDAYLLEGKGTITDVTDIFYEKEVKIKKKKEIVKWKSRLKPTDVVVETEVLVKKGQHQKEDFMYPIRAKIGVDTPSKELINGIKDREPKVSCLTWKMSDECFAYGFIFECDGDVMFWTGKDTAVQLIWDHHLKNK